MNDVKLSGRMTANPELRYTPNNIPVVSFRLAVDQPHSDKTSFVQVTAWRKTAEFIAKYFKKGQMMIVSSAWIDSGNYTDADGQNKYRLTLIAERVEFAGKNNENAD